MSETKRVRTRFAPSPTGYMHIGNLRSALYAYLIARHAGGDFIVRIEDTDQKRYVEGAVQVIFDSLRIAGMTHDEGPDIGGPVGPYTQSERMAVYRQHALALVDKGQAYYCFCTKERLDALREGASGADESSFRYDRHCLGLAKEEIQRRLDGGEAWVIRQKMPDTGETTFHCEVYGDITVENATLDDQVLLKSDGLPTYNFANVVDDHLMGITHVLRGNEYLSSCAKYNLLYDAFGWEIPVYMHLPHIVKEGGKKLSKREGDASFADFLEKGYLPEAILNYIALLGWNSGDNREFFTMDELIQAFEVSGISKSPAVFDVAKLRWFNGEYVRRLSFEDYLSMARPYVEPALAGTGISAKQVARLLQPRTEAFSDLPEMVGFLKTVPEYELTLYEHKKMKSNVDVAKQALALAIPCLEHAEPWENAALYAALKESAEQQGLKGSQVLWPVRVALSGLPSTPGGASEIAELLGQEETLARLRAARDKLAKEG